VNAVIPGWTEILQNMKTGSKYTVFIPSNLAYGEKGSGPIGPNSVLTFDIELIALK
jgi:FKBP-type peptidyl-prolyl cis-trans isomerase FkpA/FKBP-type peptidyl-prolyl cis-trans isomerase FklB